MEVKNEANELNQKKNTI